VLALACGVWPLAAGGLPQVGPSKLVLPVKACDYIESEGLDYRAYNSYEWGGYLIWRFWPGRRVFIDGRCEVYGDRIMGQARAVAAGEEGWERILDDWAVEMLLVRYRRKDSAHLFASGRWRCVYWDDIAVIALRDDVLASRTHVLTEFPLSNPVLFERTVGEAPPGGILDELDAVLARDPECWTALAFRARCLVRLARQQPEGRDALFASARDAARQALKFQDGHYEPWRALAEVAATLGDDALAAKADRKARKLRRRLEGSD
jgi:hypothetical protein